MSNHCRKILHLYKHERLGGNLAEPFPWFSADEDEVPE